jgi:hypothetical protein
MLSNLILKKEIIKININKKTCKKTIKKRLGLKFGKKKTQ